MPEVLSVTDVLLSAAPGSASFHRLGAGLACPFSSAQSATLIPGQQPRAGIAGFIRTPNWLRKRNGLSPWQLDYIGADDWLRQQFPVIAVACVALGFGFSLFV
jgi:hypothetical protein